MAGDTQSVVVDCDTKKRWCYDRQARLRWRVVQHPLHHIGYLLFPRDYTLYATRERYVYKLPAWMVR